MCAPRPAVRALIHLRNHTRPPFAQTYPRALPSPHPVPQGFVRSTTKYWVRAEDVSNVKYHILQHLPVFQHDKDKFGGGFQGVSCA